MAASWGAVDFDWRIIPLLIFGWYLLLKRWERDGVLDDGTLPESLDSF